MSKIDQNIFDEVKEIVVERLQLDVLPRDINADTRLLEEGFKLDSITILDIVAALEDRFNILIDDDDLSNNVFNDMKSLVKLITSVLKKSKN